MPTGQRSGASTPKSFDEQIALLEKIADILDGDSAVRWINRYERAAIRALLQAYGRLAMEVERAER